MLQVTRLPMCNAESTKESTAYLGHALEQGSKEACRVARNGVKEVETADLGLWCVERSQELRA